MTKKQLLEDMRRSVDGAATMSLMEIKGYLGLGVKSCRRYVLGLPHLGSGTGKRYFAEDVADRLIDEYRGREGGVSA